GDAGVVCGAGSGADCSPVSLDVNRPKLSRAGLSCPPVDPSPSSSASETTSSQEDSAISRSERGCSSAAPLVDPLEGVVVWSCSIGICPNLVVFQVARVVAVVLGHLAVALPPAGDLLAGHRAFERLEARDPRRRKPAHGLMTIKRGLIDQLAVTNHPDRHSSVAFLAYM